MATIQRRLNRCCIVRIASGDLRPQFWLSTLKPKSSGLRASICRLDGDGKKCPNGLAIDPLGTGSAQVYWRYGSQARYIRQI